MGQRWISALVGLPLVIGACVLSNPNFTPAGESEASTGGGDGSVSASLSDTSGASAATGDPTRGGATDSSASGASGGETSGGETSGVATSASSTTTATDATTDTTTTTSTTTDATADATTDPTTTGGGVPPGIYAVDPTIATCVLLNNGNGYGGPPVCTANADAQNDTALKGLMQLDTSVVNLDGKGRRAEAYLRFDIPPEYAEMTIAGATLYAQIADGRGELPHGPGGILIATAAFDDDTLASGPPAPEGQLAPAKGYLNANQSTSWALPAELIVPGQGLFLGLQPTDGDGTIYRGKTTPGAPYLELVLQ